MLKVARLGLGLRLEISPKNCYHAIRDLGSSNKLLSPWERLRRFLPDLDVRSSTRPAWPSVAKGGADRCTDAWRGDWTACLPRIIPMLNRFLVIGLAPFVLSESCMDLDERLLFWGWNWSQFQLAISIVVLWLQDSTQLFELNLAWIWNIIFIWV